MANIASAEKQRRQAEKRNERNRAGKSALRTALKKTRGAIVGGDEGIILQGRRGNGRPRRLEMRPACRQARRQQAKEQQPHGLWVRAMKASSRSLSSVVRSAISSPAACAAVTICSTLVALGR